MHTKDVMVDFALSASEHETNLLVWMDAELQCNIIYVICDAKYVP